MPSHLREEDHCQCEVSVFHFGFVLLFQMLDMFTCLTKVSIIWDVKFSPNIQTIQSKCFQVLFFNNHNDKFFFFQISYTDDGCMATFYNCQPAGHWLANDTVHFLDADDIKGAMSLPPPGKMKIGRRVRYM